MRHQARRRVQCRRDGAGPREPDGRSEALLRCAGSGHGSRHVSGTCSARDDDGPVGSCRGQAAQVIRIAGDDPVARCG